MSLCPYPWISRVCNHQRDSGPFAPEQGASLVRRELRSHFCHSCRKPSLLVLRNQLQFLKKPPRIMREAVWYPKFSQYKLFGVREEGVGGSYDIVGSGRGHSSPAPCSDTRFFILKLECPWHFWAFNVLPYISLLWILLAFILTYRDNLKSLTCNSFVRLSLMISSVRE